MPKQGKPKPTDEVKVLGVKAGRKRKHPQKQSPKEKETKTLKPQSSKTETLNERGCTQIQ